MLIEDLEVELGWATSRGSREGVCHPENGHLLSLVMVTPIVFRHFQILVKYFRQEEFETIQMKSRSRRSRRWRRQFTPFTLTR